MLHALFPPICCSASPSGPGLVMPPTPEGRHCKSMTGCEPSGSRRRARWPPRPCLARKKRVVSHCQQHRVAARGGCPEQWRSRGRRSAQLTRRSTPPARSWDMFDSQFGRQSIDGRGGTVSITVHYGRDYDNAFWDGTQLVFGDGDGADL